MCTVIIIRECVSEHPLVVAANRDEMLNRPWSPPSLIADHPGVFAPRDKTAGGTWIGFNEAGLLATITNRMWRTKGDPPSRGKLCLSALTCPSLSRACAQTERVVANMPHHGFNLLIADKHTAILLQYGGNGLTVTEIPAGVHILTSLHDLNPALLTELRDTVTVAAESGGGLPDLEPVLTQVLTDHRKFDALYSVCKHGETYATRSSTLIAFHADGGAVFRFAPGQPCRLPLTSFEAPFARRSR